MTKSLPLDHGVTVFCHLVMISPSVFRISLYMPPITDFGILAVHEGQYGDFTILWILFIREVSINDYSPFTSLKTIHIPFSRYVILFTTFSNVRKII